MVRPDASFTTSVFPTRGESKTIARPRGAPRLHTIDPVPTEQFIGVAQHITNILAAAIEGNLPFLLGNIETKGRLVYRITRQPRHVGRSRIRERAPGIDPVWIEEAGALHAEGLASAFIWPTKTSTGVPFAEGNDRLER